MVDITQLDQAFLRWQFRFSRREQLQFLDVLLRLVVDGVQPSRVCEHISEIGLPAHRAVAAVILRGLDEGRTVGDAMAPVFARDIVSAIGAAEQSGGLAATGMDVLERLQEQNDAKKGVYTQLVAPAGYLLFAAVLYMGFARWVWPKFETTGTIDGYALATYDIGLFLVHWWPMLLLAMVIVPVLSQLLLRRYAGAGRRLLDRLWPISLYRELIGANALDDLGTLMAAGQEARSAIRTVSHMASPYARAHFDKMQRRLDEGHNIADILDVGLITKPYLAHLKLLAEHRNLRQTMAATGVTARTLALARLRRTARGLNVIGLAVVAVSFAALITGVYFTAQDIQAQAGTTFG